MAKVVVIDDRVTNRNILARLAASVEEGLEVRAFERATAALHEIEGGLEPDLIVTDFNMPEMDGATFIRAVRDRAATADVPIIVVTVYEDRDYRYRALEAGATDFLLSPVDHLEFRARARNLLTLRRQQRLLVARAAELERDLLSRGAAPLGGHGGDLERLPVAASVTDARGLLLDANAAFLNLFGRPRDGAIGRPLIEILDEAEGLRQSVLDAKVRDTGEVLTALGPTPRSGEAELVIAKAPLADATGVFDRVLTLSFDASSLLARHRADAPAPGHDALTGLPGSTLFFDRLDQAVSRAKRQGEGTAVLYLDLDRFKRINSAFGSEVGDEVLRQVAHRLNSRLRETDTISRLKDDEFAIVQPEIKRAEDAAEFARRLGESFAEPFLVGGREIHMSVSTGIALFPSDAEGAQLLHRNAELAMYRAKASGRDAYRFFARHMNQAARRAVTLERELRQALAQEQFVVHYQPQLTLATGQIIGMEALVRWRHPHRGIVLPGEFIGLAEDIGLIEHLTAFVLKTACVQNRAWRAAGLGDLRLSVNLSPVQFRERGVEFLIERTLKESGLPPGSLEVEITENAVIENSRPAAACLRHLNKLGVGLSIDDFGTGYSSLSYVKRLPVQRLKIDRSFVQGLVDNANDEVIVRAIINLGHSLGLAVIAEGVETAAQLELLRRLGCDEIQGNHLSPAIDAAAFEAFLRGLSSAPAAAFG